MTTEYLCVDADCSICGTTARVRTCDDCGAEAIVTDCGHQVQPRPIAAGRVDGRQMHRDYCTDCAEQYCTAECDDVRVRVWADEGEDDCLAAAVEAYLATHPGLEGWDLHARWEDGERESIVLTVPAWAVAPDDERLEDD